MRRSVLILAATLVLQLLASSALAQDKLAGRWVGKTKSPRGERDTTATFKKEGDHYTGVISGFQPGQEVPLKNIKVDGDKITAVAEVETPQAAITINYKFTLAGDAMTGQGSLDFNGNPITFDVDLKREGAGAAPAAASAASGPQDKLAGRWIGKIKSMQGEADANAAFKKEGDQYSGTMSGMRPGQNITLKNIKVDGDKMTAIAEVETPQAAIVINYKFTLKGEAMTGQGSLDFNGNAFTFDLDLKRDNGAAPVGGAAGASAATTAPARPAKPASDQPQQKQSIDYFVGKWSFRVVGRESALAPSPRQGTVTFTKRADGKSVEGVVEGTADGKPYRDTIILAFDEASKTLMLTEKLASGAQINGKGDWSSPIAVRFAVDPVKLKGQSLQLRRTLSIVAAHSFTVTEELSEDGGPFVRLGNAVYSKAQ